MFEDRIIESLKLYVKEQVSQDKFSGNVLLAKDGLPIFEYSSGLANSELGIANSSQTKFNLGSANKMFTGVAIAHLVQAGKLDFQYLVGKHLPEYENSVVREQVTIHHLLTHTAGLGSFIDTDRRAEYLVRRAELKTISDVVRLFEKDPLPFPIGESHYSPNGYEVLGLIIEAVSGLDYYDYIREHIYKVANMTDTDCYEIDPDSLREDIAIGYTNRDPMTDQFIEGERFSNVGVNPLKGTAGGSGYSTCEDLLNFTKALLDHKLLSPEMTEVVITPKVNEGSKGNQTKYQGYGFQIFDIDGVRRIGHPGRFAGVNTRIDMYPEIGYTMIVLANYDPPSAFDVAERLTELLA